MKKLLHCGVAALFALLVCAFVTHPWYDARSAVPISGSEGIVEIKNVQPQPERTAVSETVSARLTAAIDGWLADSGLNRDDMAIVVRDLQSDGLYRWNADEYFIAGSTYKVPLAMLYYEKLDSGALAKDDSLQCQAIHYEDGEYGLPYAEGAWVPLEELLHRMIVDSDNTSAHILFENLGGWNAYREAIACYDDDADYHFDPAYDNYENAFTAAYLSSVLDVLAAHPARYATLLADMEKAKPDDYLNTVTGPVMAQKYGQYEAAENAIGLSVQGHPYNIVVLTRLGDAGRTAIGDLNAVVYDTFAALDEAAAEPLKKTAAPTWQRRDDGSLLMDEVA